MYNSFLEGEIIRTTVLPSCISATMLHCKSVKAGACCCALKIVTYLASSSRTTKSSVQVVSSYVIGQSGVSTSTEAQTIHLNTRFNILD